MTDVTELVKALREEADWCKAIEWEIPICTEDHLREAADLIEKLASDYKTLFQAFTKVDDDLFAVTTERNLAIHGCKNALKKIEALETNIGRLVTELEAVKKERDAPTVYASPVEWHKVTARPLTDEEAEYYTEIGIEGIEYIFDCEMPEDGQEILVATKWGVDKDICCNDVDYGIELEGRGDWDGVFAWAEMPKYEEDK